MTKTSTKKTLIFGIVALIIGFSVYAFAYGPGMMNGGGYGGYGMMNGGGGYGPGMMNGYYMGNGGHMWDNLSVEDQQKMQDQMNNFFSTTQELRKQYYQKRVELNQEYSKSEKDRTKIDTLEKELFDLSTQIEKSRFDHMNKMQDLFTDNSPGNTPGNYMGRGGYLGCF